MQLTGFKCAVIALAVLVATALVRRYALARNVLDVPSGRSSHTRPTPRGGGMAILLCYLVSFAWGPGRISSIHDVLFLAAGLAVGAVGFLDDHIGIRARWRFLVHIASAGLCVWNLSEQRVGFPNVVAEAAVWAFAILFLAWMINLYNFMDGIDGIAGVEAITVAIGGVVVTGVTGQPWEQGLAPLFLAAAVLGFLYWNFPSARIFLGDSGSGFIGLMMGFFALNAGVIAPAFFFAWIILLGCFIIDATVTLLRRVIGGMAFYTAHRDHAYQHAAIIYGSHVRVTLAVGAINLVWLLPIAVIVTQGVITPVVGLLVAYLPLVLLAFHFRAGFRKLTPLELQGDDGCV